MLIHVLLKLKIFLRISEFPGIRIVSVVKYKYDFRKFPL